MRSHYLLALLVFAAPLVAQTNPLPHVNNPLVPATIAPGGPGFLLTVNGTGFVKGSVVQWNSGSVNTGFISNTQLIANVPPAAIAQKGTVAVAVFNPAPGGGRSNVTYFQIRRAAPTESFGQSIPFPLSPFVGDGGEVAGDFNGDGKLDLAFVTSTNQPSSVEISLGNGNGTFQPVVDYPLDLAFGHSPIVGDFNHDGHLDIVVVGDNYATLSGDVSLLLGKGDGTFQQSTDFFVSGTGTTQSVNSGDFNGDGYLDLAVGIYNYQGDAQVAILLGGAHGTFGPPVYFTAGSDYTAEIAPGDFNRDGKLDLAVGVSRFGGPYQLAILLGGGDGTFNLLTSYDLPYIPLSLLSADLDNDGILDLVVGISGSTAMYFRGNADGTFAGGVTLVANGYIQGPLAAADVNGDGKLDLIMPGYYVAQEESGDYIHYSQIMVFKKDGNGSFEAKYYPAPYLYTFALGDFDGDGKVDIAATGEPNRFGPYSLYILPQSDAVLSASFVNFGSVEVGTSSSIFVTLKNLSGLSIDISKINIQRGEGFAETNDCGASLAPAEHCTLTLTFAPRDPGFFWGATVNISDSAVPGQQQIEMKGRGGQ